MMYKPHINHPYVDTQHIHHGVYTAYAPWRTCHAYVELHMLSNITILAVYQTFDLLSDEKNLQSIFMAEKPEIATVQVVLLSHATFKLCSMLSLAPTD